LRGYSAIRRP